MTTLSIPSPRPFAGLAVRTARRFAAVLASSLLFAAAAQAAPQVSALVPAPQIVPAGGTVTNTVRVADVDDAPIGAPGFAFTFTIPANSIYRGLGAGAPPGANCVADVGLGGVGPGVVTCSGITLAAAEKLDFPLLLEVRREGSLIVTAAIVNGTTPSETKSITVNKGADVALAITATGTAASGSVQDVSFRLTNNGPDASSGSQLSYPIPQGITLLPASLPAGCNISGATLLCDVGTIGVGASVNLAVKGTITAATNSTVTHQAAVKPVGAVGDGVSQNNDARVNTTVTAGTVLTLGKSHDGGQLLVGQNFNFSLSPRFSGNPPVGIKIEDILPANFRINGPVVAPTGWTCSVSGQTVSCLRTDIGGNGGSGVSLGNIVIPVTAVSAGNDVLNTATLSSGGALASTVDASASANVANASTDFRGEKSRSWPQDRIPLLQPFEYTVGTTNLGGTKLLPGSRLTLTDTLPTGVQINSVTPRDGYVCVVTKGGTTVVPTPALPVAGPATVTCTRTTTADVNVGDFSSIIINASVTSATTAGVSHVNSMCVGVTLPAGAPTNGANPDGVPGNNCTGVGIGGDNGPTTADVQVRKRVVGIGATEATRQIAGEPVSWAIEVVNRGPAEALDVSVTDQFIQVVSGAVTSVVPGGAVPKGVCALGDLTNGRTSLASGCGFTRLPVCHAAGEPPAGLPACPVINVAVRHYGDASATNQIFTIANKASALALTPADPVLDDDGRTNSDTATAYYRALTDVTVAKSASPSTVPAGQKLTYSLTASNRTVADASFSAAFGVKIRDTLPANLMFLRATPNGGGGVCDVKPSTTAPTTATTNNILECTWARLDRGVQQTVSVEVRPLEVLFGAADIENNVSVTTVTDEAVTQNNTAKATVKVTVPDYDLVVQKTDDVDPANVGDLVTYTITLSNNKPSTAEDVVLVDTLPANPSPTNKVAPVLVSVTPAAGTTYALEGGAAIGEAGGRIVFSVPTLGGDGETASGEPKDLRFQVVLRGVSKGSFPNEVRASFKKPALDLYDKDQTNNYALENTTYRFKADVEVLSKQAVVRGTTTPLTTVSAGQTFDWLVRVINNGPQDAEVTTFRDRLPASMVIAAAPVFTVTKGVFSPLAPTCSGAVGGSEIVCNIDVMPNEGTATVRIPVTLREAGAPINGTQVTNRASIVTTGSGDTNGGAVESAGNNFKDGSITVQTARISGRVYEDLDGNGAPGAGEPGLVRVTVTLTGTDTLNNPVSLTTTTDDNGNWHFNVPAGTYTVTETQPADYQPGITRAGTVTGVGSTVGTVPPTAGLPAGISTDNTVVNIVLGEGGTSVNNNFGEVRFSSIAGRVYHDANYNDVSDVSDPGIASVTVTLSGTDLFGRPVTKTTTTATTTGDYSFGDLLPGTYALAETQPAGFADGKETIGSAGGTTTNDAFAGIALGSNIPATGYNFGEVLTRIPVRVFVDANDDGLPQVGDTGIANVVLILSGTDAAGNPVNITAVATGTSGHYEFRNVPPSSGAGYTITETQPANYAPGKANANGNPGTAQAGGNVIEGVTVAGTPPATQGPYYFAELVPSGISGRVYYDRDGSGVQGAPATEPGLAGVVITLTGTDNNNNNVTHIATTGPNGDYNFPNLAPGSYTVTQTPPSGYLPGITQAGAVTGTGSTQGTVPVGGTGVTNGPKGSNANLIQNIVLGSGGAGSTGNNFAAVKPASLSGYVYADIDPKNGKRDTGEPGISGVTVTITGTDFQGNAVTRTLLTDVNGLYTDATLPPGTYRIDETQPEGMADGSESVGTVGNVPRGTANPGGVNDRIGDITLVSEDVGVEYNFGELGGEIAGWVYVDGNNDGVRQPGEPGIVGVTLTLTGRSLTGLPVSVTAVTDATGRYVFAGLLPADATGYTIRETQPLSYADGLDAVGTLEGKASGTLGNDVISAIAYAGGNGDNYNFGERGASLAGSVYNDANANGTREPQDLPIAGVTITLTGTDADGHPVTRTAVTDANGRYVLPDLPMPDSRGYTLTETQPVGYDEGIAVPGTLGGTAQGPNVIQVGFNTPAVNGTGYDFSERSNRPASLSGKVWFDGNHNRTADSGEGGGEGWTAELMRCPDGGNTCAETALVPLYTVATDANGNYRFSDLTPGDYRVRFRSPDGRVVGGVWPTDAVQNGASGPNPTPAASDPRLSIPVRVSPGANIVQQDLPYDPGGVVYDSISATPVPGATVTLVGPPGFDPASHLLDGRDSYTTGASGGYDFFLLPGAPAGDYRLVVVPPGGYLPSSIYPPAGGALGTQNCVAPANGPVPAQINPCVVSPGAALVAGAGYYMAFQMPLGGGQHVVANNLPLDPATSTLIELRKTTSKLTVKKGELLPYRITARNTRGVPLNGVAVTDTMPPGFRFVQGSLTVRTLPGGVALPVVPQLSGRQFVVPGQNFAPNETKEYVLVAGVGVGVGEGEYVNQVIANHGVGGRVLSNLATAAVRVIPDALFDCTDVIGTVYDDKNANGYQDQDEPGIPNARIATVNGVLVTTDAEGRYHIACAAIPKEGTGSNLVLKLDERTLPSGYRTTSENPAAERATRGKVLKVNFGATVHRVVRLALQASAFDGASDTLRAEHAAQLGVAVTALAEKPAVLRLAYSAAPGEPASLGRQRAQAVKADVLTRWAQLGRERADRNEPPLFNLDIEVELVPASVKP